MIIRFKGNLSQSIIDMILRDHRKSQRMIFLLASIVAIPISFLCASMLSYDWYWGLIFSGCIALVFLVANEISLKKDYPAHLIPIEVEIFVDEDSIYVENEKGNTAKELSSVKEVKDYGDWYFISFGRNLLISGYICQKGLLKILNEYLPEKSREYNVKLNKNGAVSLIQIHRIERQNYNSNYINGRRFTYRRTVDILVV